MDNYTSVAKRKIEDLKENVNFKSTIATTVRYVILQFNDSVCKVTNFGKVTWS